VTPDARRPRRDIPEAVKRITGEQPKGKRNPLLRPGRRFGPTAEYIAGRERVLGRRVIVTEAELADLFDEIRREATRAADGRP
jgi:hypothetical protein